jgi:hypothetical protein
MAACYGWHQLGRSLESVVLNALANKTAAVPPLIARVSNCPSAIISIVPE